jgi:hypothetical protein
MFIISEGVFLWQALIVYSNITNYILFASKVGAYPREAPYRSSIPGKAPDLIKKHKTKLEQPTRDERSSLL